MLTRKTSLLIAVCLGLFIVVGTVFVLQATQFNKTHFRTGAIPAEIVNQLLPQNVPLTSLRPPALRNTDPVRYGNVTSVISVIEYGDFECEQCRTMAGTVAAVLPAYDGRVRFVWRDFPVTSQHDDALPAAVFARCAGAQGKYWEAHDALLTARNFNEAVYRDIASRTGLNLTELSNCRANPIVSAAIERDLQEARADGIQGVPLTFIGTKALEGPLDADTLKREIDAALSSL